MADNVRMIAPTKGGTGMRNTPPLADGTRYTYSNGRAIDVNPDHVRELTALGFTKQQQTAQTAPAPSPQESAPDTDTKQDDPFVTALLDAGLSEVDAAAVTKAGFTNQDALADASDEELLAIDGIGPVKLEKLRSL